MGWISLEFAFELFLHCVTGQILCLALTFQECELHKINTSLAPYSATQRKHIVSVAQTSVNGRLLRKDSKGGVRAQWLICRGWNLKLRQEEELSLKNGLGNSLYGYWEKVATGFFLFCCFVFEIGFDVERNNIQTLHVVPIALEIFVNYKMQSFYFKGRVSTHIRKILNK